MFELHTRNFTGILTYNEVCQMILEVKSDILIRDDDKGIG